MPILIQQEVEPPAPPPPPPPPPGINRPDFRNRVTWTSASGVSTVLTDSAAGYVLMPGVRGVDLPEYQIYRRASGALDGDVVTGVRAEPREIFLPVRVWARTRAEARARRRQLARDLNPQETNHGGPGLLEIAEFDGTRRTIRALYESGVEGSEGRDEAGLCWATYGITLRASDPFWSQPERTIRWSLGLDEDTMPDLFLPVLPLQAVTGQVIGEGTSLTVSGTATTWPVWTIHGPLDAGTVLRNVTSGRELELDLALTGTDTVVIDTRPRRKSVVLNETVNAYGDLVVGSALWPLLPGQQTIDVLASGAEASSEIVLTYAPQDLTA